MIDTSSEEAREAVVETQPTLLFGYMLTSSDRERPGVPGPFLMRVAGLHREMGVPFTLFVQGSLLEPYQADLQRVRDLCKELVDFQQCTFSGLPLKTVCQENHNGAKVFPAAPPDECCDDIARAMDLMERTLGTRPIGLAGPLGYYRGLSDRPDLLYRLYGLGVRFVRAYTRNARDWAPVPFEVQPFFYKAQGFDDILEIPGQGEIAIEECETIARKDLKRYIQQVCKDIDYVAAKYFTWALVQHDWCAVLNDPKMSCTHAILDHAAERGFSMLTHNAFYNAMCARERRE